MTHLNTAVATGLSAINDINENIARLKEEAKAARQKAIQPFLVALAASGQVSLIVVRGHTPGFNDGEPCEHSADVFVNVKSIIAEDVHDSGVDVDLPDELVEGLGEERTWSREHGYVTNAGILEANEALCREHGHVYAEPSPELMTAINTLIFTTAEEENRTNYYVTYQLKDGNFEVSTGEYDCGY